jgi:hypothetical protein
MTNEEYRAAVLAKDPRVSIFDVVDHRWLGNAITKLEKAKKIVRREDDQFPWIEYDVVIAHNFSSESSLKVATDSHKG